MRITRSSFGSRTGLSRRSELAVTSTVAPVSASTASHRPVSPRKVVTSTSALRPKAEATFCQITARMENFYKTTKAEEVDLQDYLDRLIRELYSRERLHSSPIYVPPVEFAAHFHSVQKRLACWSCVMVHRHF